MAKTIRIEGKTLHTSGHKGLHAAYANHKLRAHKAKKAKKPKMIARARGPVSR